MISSLKISTKNKVASKHDCGRELWGGGAFTNDDSLDIGYILIAPVKVFAPDYKGST